MGGEFFYNRGMDNLFFNRMNSWQGIVKKKQETIFERSKGYLIIIKFF